MRVSEQVRDILIEASRRIDLVGKRQHKSSIAVAKALVALAELRAKVKQ